MVYHRTLNIVYLGYTIGLCCLFVLHTVVCVCSVISQSTLCDPLDCRLFGPWGFSGKNTGVGSHFLLQGTFLTEGSNLRLLHRGGDFFTTEPSQWYSANM